MKILVVLIILLSNEYGHIEKSYKYKNMRDCLNDMENVVKEELVDLPDNYKLSAECEKRPLDK